MACVICGTLALGWSRELADVLRSFGCDVFCPDAADPYSLLMQRARAASENPGVVFIACRHDVSLGQDMDDLLADLARALMPKVQRVRIEIDADPSEYSCKCFSDEPRAARDYLGGHQLKRMRAPAYIVDTPELFRSFLRDGLSRGPSPLGAHLERPRWIWEDENCRSNVWGQEDCRANPSV